MPRRSCEEDGCAVAAQARKRRDKRLAHPWAGVRLQVAGMHAVTALEQPAWHRRTGDEYKVVTQSVGGLRQLRINWESDRTSKTFMA